MDIDGENPLAIASSASAITRSSDHQSAAGDTFKDKLSAAFGCKTSETALALIDQIVKLDHPARMDEAGVRTLQMNAIALLAELQPATATEALLAAQMIASHRA